MKLTFSIKEALTSGWRIFKAHPWLFVGSSLIYLAAQFVLGMILKMLPDMVSSLVSFLVGSLISLGFLSFYLKAHDNAGGTKFNDLWHPKSYLKYLLTSIAIAVLVMVGFVLLIVPGIIICLALSFALYLVVEKRMDVVPALKESARLTRGNRVSLFVFGLLLAVINIIGAGLLLIGLFVTVPVSLLASIHVYRLLAARAGAAPVVAEVVSPSSEPEPSAPEA